MTIRANAARELGLFLRLRRERLSPVELDLPRGARHRRTPGLRREEVADLAGLSVDYVVRIEQGRGRQPSVDVLEAYADALRLTDDERDYVFDLAGHRTGRRRSAAGRTDDRRGGDPTPSVGGPIGSGDGDAEDVDGTARRLIEDLSPLPAMLVNHRFEILVWNPEMAGMMATDFAELPPSERNSLWIGFGLPWLRDFYVDRERVVRACIADLRAAWAAYPDDAGIADLVERLSMTDDEFARLWKMRDVRVNANGRKRLRHPEVGRLTIDYESWAPLRTPDRRLVVYRPADAESEHALEALRTGGVVGSVSRGREPVGPTR